MTTQEVANRLVTLCREGKFEQAVQELYAPDIVSVEAEGTPNRVEKGLAAIAEKAARFESKIERINRTTISDPIVAENFFSMAMLMNVRMKGMDTDIDMDEICVYNVRDGKVVKEEFFYTAEPQLA